MTKRLAVLGTIVLASAAGAQEGVPTIDHAPTARATAGQPLTLNATIHSANGVFQPVVAFRHTGESNWTKVPLLPSGGGLFTATLPGATVQSDLEYYLETYDNDGNGPARAGSPDEPFHVVVLAGAGQPHKIIASSADAGGGSDKPAASVTTKKKGGISGRMIGGIAGGVVGLGGLGAGIAGWVLWNQEVQNSNHAPPSVRGTYEGPITQYVVLGSVGTGVAVLGLGVGIWLLITGTSSSSSGSSADAPKDKDSAGTFSVAPIPGGGMATYAARF